MSPWLWPCSGWGVRPLATTKAWPPWPANQSELKLIISMSQNPVSPKYLSRRDFLKFGCLTGAAAGLAVCGVGLAVSEPDQQPVDLPSFTYGESTMSTRILIAYASATGSTAEVAAEIGKRL